MSSPHLPSAACQRAPDEEEVGTASTCSSTPKRDSALALMACRALTPDTVLRNKDCQALWP